MQELKKLFSKKETRGSGSDPFFMQHFIGNLFADVLYNSENQKREKEAIWKILRTFPVMTALCNDTWKWFAVNVPLNLLEKNQPQGDIDILVAMPLGPPPRKGEWPIIYRAFEVKTSKIDASGSVKSLKERKFHKIKKQLEKLRTFGAEQIFLAEIYIAQAGYSSKQEIMPQKVSEAAMFKFKEILGAEYGYVMFFIEQMTGFDEEKTGISRPPINLHPATKLTMKQPFEDLIKHIDAFWNSQERSANQWPIIAYCSNCKKLTLPNAHINPECNTCGKSLITS